MRVQVLVIAILGLLVPIQSTLGQPEPSDADYFRRWVQSQMEQWDRIESVEFRERSRRTLDNPFGVNRAQVESRVVGYPDDREYERRIVSAEVEGRRVPPRRMEEFRERWTRFSQQLGRGSNVFSAWRLRALLATRPSGRPIREDYDGTEAYRVDLVPADRQANIDRITMWFSARGGRALASRTVFEQRGQRSSLIVEIEYERIDGIDVPRSRRIDGTVQTRRRLRHFTTIVTLESRFDEYRFSRR